VGVGTAGTGELTGATGVFAGAEGEQAAIKAPAAAVADNCKNLRRVISRFNDSSYVS